jgi:putative transposase
MFGRLFPQESPQWRKEKKPMKDWQSLSYVQRDCKYQVVIISKHRNRVVYGGMRKKIGGIIRELCRQKGIEIH